MSLGLPFSVCFYLYVIPKDVYRPQIMLPMSPKLSLKDLSSLYIKDSQFQASRSHKTMSWSCLIFWCIEESGRKSFGNCLQNNPIKLNNSWMLQRFIQGHNERKISDRLKYQKESLLFSFNKGNWLLLLCDFVGNCLQFQFFFHLSTFIHFQIPTSNRDLQAVICHLYDSRIDYNALWQNNPSEIIFVQSEVFNAVKKDFKERLT